MAANIDKNKPSARGLAYQAAEAAVALCRDIYSGTARLREQTTKYLPKWPREDDSGYHARLSTSVLFNAFARTVHGLVGMISRKDPVLDEKVPAPITLAWENIDLQGNHGAVFVQARLVDATIDGHAHIFIDMQRAPKVENGTPTLADERNAGLRPFWVGLKKQDVIRFTTVNVGGSILLNSFAYVETVCRPEGEYGEKAVLRIREYHRREGRGVECVIYEQTNPDTDEWLEVDRVPMSITEIPLVTIYAKRTGFMTSVPPLEDLAHENVKHWQTRSDRDNTLHIAGVPIPVFIGMADSGTIAVGSSAGINMPINGDVKYLEPMGVALEASRAELQDVEQRFAALGLAMLQRQTRSAETATAKAIDKSESDSALSSLARSLQDALETALLFHAMWIGEKQAGSVTVNDNFSALILDAQTIVAYLTMFEKRAISLETLWGVLAEGKALPDDFDPDEEKDRLKEADVASLPAFPTPVIPPKV